MFQCQHGRRNILQCPEGKWFRWQMGAILQSLSSIISLPLHSLLPNFLPEVEDILSLRVGLAIRIHFLPIQKLNLANVPGSSSTFLTYFSQPVIWPAVFKPWYNCSSCFLLVPSYSSPSCAFYCTVSTPAVFLINKAFSLSLELNMMSNIVCCLCFSGDQYIFVWAGWYCKLCMSVSIICLSNLFNVAIWICPGLLYEALFLIYSYCPRECSLEIHVSVHLLNLLHFRNNQKGRGKCFDLKRRKWLLNSFP